MLKYTFLARNNFLFAYACYGCASLNLNCFTIIITQFCVVIQAKTTFPSRRKITLDLSDSKNVAELHLLRMQFFFVSSLNTSIR